MRASAPLRAQARGHTQQGRLPKPDAPARKVFNCIVDESAFLAGVKKSTRDGIRKWINNGAMRLFVPLYTLEQIDRIKRAGGKPANDAQEALQWLDDVTSITEVQAAGLVQLQGGDEIYRTWEEVESFLLPETLLSMTESADEADELADELNNSLASLGSNGDKVSESSHGGESESPRSAYSATSPGLLNAIPYKIETAVNKHGKSRSRKNSRANGDIKAEPKNKSVVPVPLQPFYNHVIWRIHHEQNPDISPESFILLTNDPRKQAIAQRFSVRAKRLEQIRDIIGREERDFRNRQAWIKKEEQEDGVVVNEQKSEDEDEIVFKRAPAAKPKAGQQQVFDPNDFGRSHPIPTPRGGGRGGRGGHRGRGNFAPSAAPTPRAPPSAPKNAEPSGPIDPDSYARPPPVARSVRGGKRKLWEPA
ncbi:thiosulfate sulfurtransferase [Diplodia corticola]|uniref:Thiosulfate sulfurtransferase n=1 Tax=Diplodia corticola TaxID=236234 RepID=A0A1J9R3E4_9PEZI|nr:thiosulfate sulfurtransferase [Diplodia corticola]OJD35136.1 thiosulfate sulfurtransferase [Diplodia corticola]